MLYTPCVFGKSNNLTGWIIDRWIINGNGQMEGAGNTSSSLVATLPRLVRKCKWEECKRIINMITPVEREITYLPTSLETTTPGETDEELGMPALPDQLTFPKGFSDRAWHIGSIYEQYSRELSPEGYEEYHEACFIGMLSAIAKRRIKIPFGRGDYTPLMIILTGDTSVKKTTTAMVTREVLDAANLGWMMQTAKTTPQFLIHDMAGYVPSDYNGQLDYREQQKLEQELAFSGQRGQVIGEFGKFVKAMMNEKGPYAEFQGLLLEMDDCLPTYGNSTLSRGSDIIEKPYLSLLACMTFASIATSGKSGGEFWSDGFWARIAFICPPANFDADHPFDPGDHPVPFDLHKPLSNWHKRLGTPEITIVQKQKTNQKGEVTPIDGQYTAERGELPEVTITFGVGVLDAWKQYRSALKTLRKQIDTKDLSGNYDRLSAKAMRIAALLASLENNDRIELWHWAKAQEICERWRCSLHRTYRQINGTTTSYAKKIEDIIMDIFTRKAQEGCTELNTKNVRDGSNILTKGGAKQANDALDNLRKAGYLESVPGKKGYNRLPMTKSTLIEISDSFEE